MSTTDGSNPPSTPPEKKKKKKKAKKPFIPKNLTASLTEEQKNDLQNNPEEFENVVVKVKTGKTPPKEGTTTSPTAAAAGASGIEIKKNDGSNSNSDEGSIRSTLSPQSIPKIPDRKSRIIHDEKDDKVYEYKIDVERTYSQSSGTMSYDTVHFGEEKIQSFMLNGVNIKPTNFQVKQAKPIKSETKKIETITPFESQRYQFLITDKECPPNAKPTPEQVFGYHEKQLAKEAIITAITEYFEQDRDDLDLMIRLQRQGPFPILSMQIGPNPKTFTTLSTVSNESGTNIDSRSRIALSEDASTAKSIKSRIADVFYKLVAVIRPQKS